ncbi:hypothetical protein DESC_120097 [Desulfosarcina cetonica]|nr:hypothetical protein DESC_120097 [Desulfosarcina cetonica]
MGSYHANKTVKPEYNDPGAPQISHCLFPKQMVHEVAFAIG